MFWTISNETAELRKQSLYTYLFEVCGSQQIMERYWLSMLLIDLISAYVVYYVVMLDPPLRTFYVLTSISMQLFERVLI